MKPANSLLFVCLFYNLLMDVLALASIHDTFSALSISYYYLTLALGYGQVVHEIAPTNHHCTELPWFIRTG